MEEHVYLHKCLFKTKSIVVVGDVRIALPRLLTTCLMPPLLIEALQKALNYRASVLLGCAVYVVHGFLNTRKYPKHHTSQRNSSDKVLLLHISHNCTCQRNGTFVMIKSLVVQTLFCLKGALGPLRLVSR